MRIIAFYSSNRPKQPLTHHVKEWWLQISGDKPNLSLDDALSLVAVAVVEYIYFQRSPKLAGAVVWFIWPIVVYVLRMTVQILLIKWRGGFFPEHLFRYLQQKNFWYSIFYALVILPLLIAFLVKSFL